MAEQNLAAQAESRRNLGAVGISTEQLIVAVELSPLPILVLAADSLAIIFANSAARRFFQLLDHQASVLCFLDYVAEPLPSFRRALASLETGEQFVAEVISDGESRQFTLQKAQDCVVAVEKAVHPRDGSKVDLRRSDFDSLTRLRNRNTLNECLYAAIGRAEHGWGVLFIDLDDYKKVNDCLGHLRGDKVLAEFAEKLRASARPTDLVFRYGGDEFLIIVNGISSEQLLRRIADRIREEVSVEVKGLESTLVVTASVGCVMASPKLTMPEQIIDAADRDMYRAKRERP